MTPMENDLDKPLKKVLADLQTRIVNKTHYFGVKTIKNPLDFWVYREMIVEHKPDFVIEIGNFNGGSALAFAHILDLMDHGALIGLDIDHSHVPSHIRDHPRITFIEGDACENFPEVRKIIPEGAKVLIFEDSAHTYENTLKVLKTYGGLVQPGDYIVIEDTICHHGLDEGPSPCGYEACEEFAATHSEFEIDRSKEDFGITWNPKGFLRRVGGNVESVQVHKGVIHADRANILILLRKVYIQLMPPILVSTIRKIRWKFKKRAG